MRIRILQICSSGCPGGDGSAAYSLRYRDTGDAGRYWMGIVSVLAVISTVNTVLASLGYILSGMAKIRLLPACGECIADYCLHVSSHQCYHSSKRFIAMENELYYKYHKQ